MQVNQKVRVKKSAESPVCEAYGLEVRSLSNEERTGWVADIEECEDGKLYLVVFSECVEDTEETVGTLSDWFNRHELRKL